MKKTDVVFLASVFSFAAFFSLVSVQEALQLLPGRSSSASAVVGTAGQPRDVDVERMQRMLEQRDLSSHEALYYRPLPAASGDGSEFTEDQPETPHDSSRVDDPPD